MIAYYKSLECNINQDMGVGSYLEVNENVARVVDLYLMSINTFTIKDNQVPERFQYESSKQEFDRAIVRRKVHISSHPLRYGIID